MKLPEWLLSMLACPRCKGPLTLPDFNPGSTTPAELCCLTCGRAYPVRDGVAVLLPEESHPLRGSGS